MHHTSSCIQDQNQNQINQSGTMKFRLFCNSFLPLQLLIVAFQCYNNRLFAFKFCGSRLSSTNALTKRSQKLYSESASDAAASAAYEFMQSQGEWYSMGGCSVLLPRDRIPKSIIHFVGGFVAGSAVTVTYGRMLSALAESGHLIVATPIPAIELNHGNVAAVASTAFTNCYQSNVLPLLGGVGKDVPIFGLGHSLGGKLMVLMNSKKEDRKTLPPRAGNVFLAFNNYGVQENIDLGKAQAAKASPEVQKIFDAVNRPEVQKMIQTAKDNKMVSDVVSSFFQAVAAPPRSSDNGRKVVDSPAGAASAVGDMMSNAMNNLGNQLGIDIKEKVTEFASSGTDQLKFTPTSEETWQLLLNGYNVQRNYMVKFIDDEIDQSNELSMKLRQRGCDVKITSLPGNHVTPNVLVAGVGGDTASVPFLRHLTGLLNTLSDDAWLEVERRRNEKLMLPKKVSS